jgi:hypothetical protein
LFKQLRTPKQFSQIVEDDYIKLEMQGIVIGEIESLVPFYERKEQKVFLPIQKEKIFFASAAVGSNFDLKIARELYNEAIDFFYNICKI